MRKPLEGIKVVDFSLAGAGPSCTKLLKEAGADVVWVEPVTGTGTRLVRKFDFYTAGKRSIPLNLKTPEGAEIMDRLLARADVFVTNYRYKAVTKLGLSYETLHEKYPRLVYGLLTGFGTEGPEKDDPGYDTVAFWAEGGLLKDFAEDGSLVVAPYAVGDISTGGYLAGGIAMALYGREKSGEGTLVMTSLLNSAAYMNHHYIIESQYGNIYPITRKRPLQTFLNSYQCGDGEWLTVCMGDYNRYFVPLCKEVLECPELLEDPRWKSNADFVGEKGWELVKILDEKFKKLTRDEAVRRLKAIDAPCAAVVRSDEVLDSEQMLANQYLYKLEATQVPEGRAEGDNEIIVPAGPIKFDSIDSNVAGQTRGPILGEHSVSILKEIGYSEQDIQAFIEKKITVQSE